MFQPDKIIPAANVGESEAAAFHKQAPASFVHLLTEHSLTMYRVLRLRSKAFERLLISMATPPAFACNS